MEILLLFLAEAAEPTTSTSYVVLGVAAIGIITTFTTSYFVYKGNKDVIEGKAEINRLTVLQNETQVSLSMAKREIDLDSYALSFSSFMESWNEVAASLNIMFKETKTERFLLLRAWDGYSAPRYTTAIIQYRQGKAEYSDYIHFELDNDYVEKLLGTRRRKMWVIDTAKEGDTAIAGLYRSEVPPVTHANWYFVHDEKIDEKRTVITYCSFGTSNELPFDKREEVKHRLLVGIIQSKFDGQSYTTR